jgi:hypothetical protein
MTDHAVARRTDPHTSWAAAKSLDPTALRESQSYILGLLQDHGPMTDEELVAITDGKVSPSGTRTRRSELVAKGLVYDTGKRVVLRSGRHAIVWAARWVEIQSTLWGGVR